MSQCWSVLQFSLDTGDSRLNDRCYCQLMFVMFERMADVIANLVFVADVLATVIHVWWNWHEARCYGLGLLCDWCYCHFDVKFCLADVIANVGNHFNCCKGTCPWLMLLPLWLVRLMLLPLCCFKADVIAFCYCCLADVIAWWLMLLPHAVVFGWCYCQGGWC